MTAGLTRQALRRHPWSFAGPAITQCLAATIVSGALSAAASFGRPRLDGAARRALAESGVREMATIFVMVSIYLSILVVGVTMGATIGRQARDIALVRTVGATPGQVRRAVAVQAAVVAVPAALVGWPLGLAGGRAWVAGLVGHGVVPAAVTFHPSAAALPAALAVTVVTSTVGALIAAVRPSRVRPAVALAEAGAPRRRGRAVRILLGIVLVAGGVALSASITRLPARRAEAAGLFVMLAMCVGAGLLGPVLLRVAAPFARLGGRTARLAADNLVVRAGALSGALVPLVLAIAFALVKVSWHETARHVTGVREPAAELWTEYSGTAVYTAFAAVAALNTLITLTLARRRDLAVLRLAGGTRGRTIGMLVWEALVVTVTAVVVAAGVAATTLLPLVHTALGTWTPWLPGGHLLVGFSAVAALVLAGTVPPAALGLWRSPVAAVETGP